MHTHTVSHTHTQSQSVRQSVTKKKHQAGKASSVGTHTEHKQADRVGTQETGNDSRRKRLLQIERRYRWASIRNKVGGWVGWGRVLGGVGCMGWVEWQNRGQREQTKESSTAIGQLSTLNNAQLWDAKEKWEQLSNSKDFLTNMKMQYRKIK